MSLDLGLFARSLHKDFRSVHWYVLHEKDSRNHSTLSFINKLCKNGIHTHVNGRKISGCSQNVATMSKRVMADKHWCKQRLCSPVLTDLLLAWDKIDWYETMFLLSLMFPDPVLSENESQWDLPELRWGKKKSEQQALTKPLYNPYEKD